MVVFNTGVDTFGRVASFPFMSAYIGEQFVTAALLVGESATVRLRSKAGTERGVAHVKGDADQRF